MIPPHTWETFLRLARPADVPPVADAAWLITQGVDPDAPEVLRNLRDEVLPLVRHLERERGLTWYCFLVHSRESGVPTEPDDRDYYIHLRLAFPDDGALDLPSKWRMTRRADLSSEIARVDAAVFAAPVAWAIVGEQSAWFLSFVERHGASDLLALTKHARQFLHFFANMAQMKVM